MPLHHASEGASARISALYQRHRDDVFRVALRYASGDREWAEDVVQDLFVSLCRVFARVDDPDHLGGWLYRTTCNRCLSKLRRRALENTPGIRWLLGEKQSTPPNVESTVSQRQQLGAAFAVLDKLPSKQRLAFCMFHLDGKKIHEIGEILGHSKGYISKLISRAALRLRADGWEIRDA
ncbi:MAG: sigma-70 family RNA polymerase sigma factor [Nannocystaceae bacterium]